ncbi:MULTISPECIES: hypothetical protein [Halolamina]|uniref:DUF8149 domain-containing protein n=1 Tax=Halolamina pelagica TaxID=699431 RepID=A0A1I5RS48_9EURY|nr:MULTISPECIES: hypothetical protein [Halolamina]NHX35318.1 hypothetical protein [Halolamina sp. R1-12]SFP61342.1 hypothetical protein SAMN05216277_105114 [Halolamina pelagica]
MSDDDGPEVPIHCPECETTTRVPLDDLAERIERHNESVHDGEEFARVDPELAAAFQDLVVEDLGLLEEE